MNYKELLINKDKVVMASVDLACVIGDCEEAIVLNQVSYWIERYREINRNCKDGRFWVYNSYQKWHDDNFPFWHPSKIQRIFKSLEKKGLLLSANHNNAGFDKTKWYTIDYEKLQRMADDYESESPLFVNGQSLIENKQWLIRNEQSLPKYESPLIRNEQSLIAGEYPIPEDTTEDTTENTTEDTAGYKYILSGKPDDASGSADQNASGKPKKTRNTRLTNHPEEIRQVIDYFNRVCGTNYKHQSKATAEMINARINDGFKVEDFYKVIDKKHAEWKNDSKYCKYLRPETLFRPSHFESYLNQMEVSAGGEDAGGVSQEMADLYNAVIIK